MSNLLNHGRRRSIYVIVGTDGPRYVGCTSEPVSRRFEKHLSAARSRPLLPISKHMAAVGLEHFRVECVAESRNHDDGCATELAVIKQLAAWGLPLLNVEAQPQINPQPKAPRYRRALDGEWVHAGNRCHAASKEATRGAHLLRGFAASRGLTQRELQRLLGCSADHISRWCRGNDLPSHAWMRAICEATGGAVPFESWFKRAQHVASTRAA